MLETRPSFGLLMLAAGLSRRMGGPNKLLQPYRGRPLLAHALRITEEFEFRDRVAVTGRDSAQVQALAETFNVRCVFNPRFAEGLGTSIAAGARALGPDINGVFIALGDMPEIEPDVYSALAGKFMQHSIILPLHRGSRGHPVLFCTSYISELSALSGDEGARSLLRGHANRIAAVETANPGVLRDIDTREDFETLHRFSKV
ncbi:MAG TPA: nucleotidyltransferase family protein [Rhodomicrobium sp.]|nr:nucleotidyltransferase family protein [Rhodomicrobium sp.]